jgi:hypothetical protein
MKGEGKEEGMCYRKEGDREGNSLGRKGDRKFIGY